MRSVKIAYLHTNIQVPGIGEFGRNLNTTDTQYKFRDAKLAWSPGEGLKISFRGQEIMIPYPNVAYLVFAAEDPKVANVA